MAESLPKAYLDCLNEFHLLYETDYMALIEGFLSIDETFTKGMPTCTILAPRSLFLRLFHRHVGEEGRLEHLRGVEAE